MWTPVLLSAPFPQSPEMGSEAWFSPPPSGGWGGVGGIRYRLLSAPMVVLPPTYQAPGSRSPGQARCPLGGGADQAATCHDGARGARHRAGQTPRGHPGPHQTSIPAGAARLVVGCSPNGGWTDRSGGGYPEKAGPNVWRGGLDGGGALGRR